MDQIVPQTLESSLVFLGTFGLDCPPHQSVNRGLPYLISGVDIDLVFQQQSFDKLPVTKLYRVTKNETVGGWVGGWEGGTNATVPIYTNIMEAVKHVYM